MKNDNQLLESINATLRSQLKVLCCKLDELIIAGGGSPVLYNTFNSTVVAPGNSYTSPEAHSIGISVIGGDGDVADVLVNGVSSSWPVGYNANPTATTVFAAGSFEVEATSTATVIVNTITV